jgi:hypothetical protein
MGEEKVTEEAVAQKSFSAKLLTSIGAGSALIAGSIWVGKPAEPLPQFDTAEVITTTDARIVEATEQVVRDDTGKVVATIPVPERMVRDQVSTHIDQVFRIGDVFKVTVCRNDSIISEKNVIINEDTYPQNGNVLKAINYTQWVESRE